MNSFKVLALVCLVVAKVRSSPIPQPQPQPDNDLFAGFLRNAQLGAPSKDSTIVKRRIFEDNPDRDLKQISLSSLIGDIEQGLFASALSVNNVINHKTAEVEEIKPVDDQEHNINKRQLKDLPKIDDIAAVTTESSVPEARKIILQTTEKVPEAGGVPAHYIIDRIAIQPHTVGVPLLPTFAIQRTRTDDQTNDHEITKITISKTEITSVPNTPAPTLVQVTSTTAEEAVEGTTTPKNIEQLKEAEEELKEKVAEIEAEPIILTARV